MTYPSQECSSRQNQKPLNVMFVMCVPAKKSGRGRCRSLRYELSDVGLALRWTVLKLRPKRNAIRSRRDGSRDVPSKRCNSILARVTLESARANERRRARVVAVWPGRPTTPMYILLFDATCWSQRIRERERKRAHEHHVGAPRRLHRRAQSALPGCRGAGQES